MTLALALAKVVGAAPVKRRSELAGSPVLEDGAPGALEADSVHIVVDITHPCDVNFFRACIRRWRGDGHDVSLVVLDRGRLLAIVDHEYPELPRRRVGRHASSRLGLYFRTGLWRELELGAALLGRRPDVVVGFPGFQTALIGRVLGAKSVGCYDDPEHRINMELSKLFCHTLVLPEYLEQGGPNVRPMRALKEWAYLSPRYFTPDPTALKPYGLEPRQYVFVREIEPRSLNYMHGGSSVIGALYDAGLRRERVVLSLEDKRRRPLFSEWTILEEPVRDIHSLMYYSRMVVSNGDSMAREGAQLGVPSIYAGTRAMKANDVLYRLGLLRQLTTVDDLLSATREPPGSEDRQTQARARLRDEWEDVADVVSDAVYALGARGRPSAA